MFNIGVISDTHGYWDPEIPRHFCGVQHILHAGDIGSSQVLAELEAIAPVTAVRGNNDWELNGRDTEIVTLAGHLFLVRHIVDVHRPSEDFARLLKTHTPAAVIFGHTHQPFCATLDSILYLNPGYAGQPRFRRPRSVAVIACRREGLRVEFRSF